MQTKLSISPSHSILTPGQPVTALTLYRQEPGRVATGVSILKSLDDSTQEKSRRKRDSNPGSSALEADTLTTRPTRRLGQADGSCYSQRIFRAKVQVHSLPSLGREDNEYRRIHQTSVCNLHCTDRGIPPWRGETAVPWGLWHHDRQ